MPPPREPPFERRLVPQAGAQGEKQEVCTLAVCVRSGRERDPSAGLQGENASSQGSVEGHRPDSARRRVGPAADPTPAEGFEIGSPTHGGQRPERHEVDPGWADGPAARASRTRDALRVPLLVPAGILGGDVAAPTAVPGITVAAFGLDVGDVVRTPRLIAQRDIMFAAVPAGSARSIAPRPGKPPKGEAFARSSLVSASHFIRGAMKSGRLREVGLWYRLTP